MPFPLATFDYEMLAFAFVLKLTFRCSFCILSRSFAYLDKGQAFGKLICVGGFLPSSTMTLNVNCFFCGNVKPFGAL